MEHEKQVKIRFTEREAEAIAEAVDQRPGESLALAIKKYFNTKQYHSSKVQNDDKQNSN